MLDRTDKEWQGKLMKALSEMTCPTTVRGALQDFEVLGIDVAEAQRKLTQVREQWTKNKKLLKLGLAEAGFVFLLWS